jgi:2-keto-3-deoxy-L-arabinonate dehydratase
MTDHVRNAATQSPGRPSSRSGFHGIYPMLYAFFGKDGTLDRGAMARQVDACVASGAHGVSILGLATEGPKLDVRERRELLDVVAQALDGRLPLAVTTAEPSVVGQVEFAKAAASVGAAWIILQPPPLGGAAEAQWIEFFCRVGERVSHPLAIQNAPGLIANSLSVPALLQIHRRIPHLCLLKGEGPATYVHRLVHETDGRFDVFNGYAGLQLPDSLRAGCVGTIPGMECADVLARVYEGMAFGTAAERDRAEEAHRAILPLLVFLMSSVDHLLAYGKRLAARRLGLGDVHDRAPATPASAFGLECLDRHARLLGPLP